MRMSYGAQPYELGAYKECYGMLLIEKAVAGDELVRSYFDHLDEVFSIRARSDRAVRDALEERQRYDYF